jgi:hypothetical protein
VTWPNRILLAALIAGAIAFFPRRDAVEPEDLGRVSAEREELAAKVEALRIELASIEAEVRALHRPSNASDSGASELARIARSDLKLVKPGEVVFEIERVQKDAGNKAASGAGVRP